MLSRIGLAVGLVLAASDVGVAQVTQETRTTTTPGGTTTEIRRVSQLIGSNVRLQGAGNFAKVEDVVLDNSGGIGYLVVAKGNRYALLPWDVANVDYGQRVVTYDVAPRAVQPLFFEQNAWPSIYDQQFTTRVHQVFPNARAVRREVLRPVPGTLPAPGGPVVKEKVKVKRSGEVRIKEQVK